MRKTSVEARPSTNAAVERRSSTRSGRGRVFIASSVLAASSVACGSGSFEGPDASGGASTSAGASASGTASTSGGRNASAGANSGAGAGGSTGGMTGSGGAAGASGNGGAGRGGSARGGAGSGGAAGVTGGECASATRLWHEDFETGDYSRWTSNTYGNAWGNDCQSNAVATERAVSGTRSQRSEITCAYTAEENVHRGYGGLQFNGDDVLPGYTNTGEGIDAPYGVVNTFHSWLDTDTVFENGTWFSFWTVNSSCDWSEPVLTLGLEDSARRLAAAHYAAGAGGERIFLPGAPAFPLGRWVRITIYLNYHDQVLHVWQDGQQVSRVTFDRPRTTICQWHWGAYASGDNDDLVLFEDDNSIWKLDQRWTDFSVEPWFGGSVSACNAP